MEERLDRPFGLPDEEVTRRGELLREHDPVFRSLVEIIRGCQQAPRLDEAGYARWARATKAIVARVDQIMRTDNPDTLIADAVEQLKNPIKAPVYIYTSPQVPEDY